MITRDGFVDAPTTGEVGGIFQHMRSSAQDPDILVVRNVADVEPILVENARLRREAREGNGGYSPSRDLRRVAQIPNILIHKWLVEEGINVYRKEDWPKVAAKLDDPEYEELRTAPGRVSSRPVRSHPTTARR